ncbi:MAG: DUF2057 domain-containing protein [Colwellia sp.]|nr:DUF2057 domain-containing protein [Colwellia sp.]
MRAFNRGYLLLFILAFNANASELTLSDNLVLRDVNDKPVEHSIFQKKQKLTLGSGNHTLVVQYKDVFEDLDMGEEKLVKSDYFVVKFLLESQQKLILSTIKIRDLAAAERFARQPELTLLDENKQGVVLLLEKLSDYELAKKVTQVVSTLSAPVDNVSTKAKVMKDDKDDKIFNDNVINQVDTMPMLKYWWKKASTEERASFLQFVNKSKH